PPARRFTTSTNKGLKARQPLTRLPQHHKPMAEQIAVTSPAAKLKRPNLSLSQSNSLLGYSLVAPVVICLLVLVFYPFAFAVWISFTNRTVGSEGNFIGLGNFLYLFNNLSFQAT